MPNLHQFIITIINPSSFSTPWNYLFDGYQWKELLIKNTPYLNLFDISLYKFGINLELDFDTVQKSFEYFIQKYNNHWNLAIHRSIFRSNNSREIKTRLMKV